MITKEQQERFLAACRKTMKSSGGKKGIGTLGERTLHAAIKAYLEPEETRHEVPVGPFVADIRKEDGIVEIQTRDFNKLRKKLDYFLELGPVTVIYPVPMRKWLSWIEEDGTVIPPRKSPKQAGPQEIFRELYRIKSFLKEDGLRFCILLLELEEYRLKNGWGNGGKRGSTRFDRMPVALLDEVWITGPEDYGKLIPETLGDSFTAKEFSKAARISEGMGTLSMNVLHFVGAAERVGKKGNAYLYRRRAAAFQDQMKK